MDACAIEDTEPALGGAWGRALSLSSLHLHVSSISVEATNMDQSRGLLSSLIMGVRRAVTEGVTAMRIDSLLTLVERL